MSEAVPTATALLRVRGIGLRVRDTVARVRESGPAPSAGRPEAPIDDRSGSGPDRVERSDRVERLGRAGVAAITGVVALTWFPLLGMPFGDNHLGRIIGRYALHLRNLQEQESSARTSVPTGSPTPRRRTRTTRRCSTCSPR
ncbi:hypothetical protein [Plantactinospora veratri]